MGLLPVDVTEHQETAPSTNKKNMTAVTFSGGIEGKQLAVLYRQMAQMLRSGVPILRALQFLIEQTTHVKLKNILIEIHSRVREGKPLSDAVAMYPKVFKVFDIALIRTGESMGDMEGALVRIADYRVQQQELTAKVRSAFVYPMFVLAVGFATVIFMLTAVIPKFATFFKDLGQELPLATQILIGTSNAFREGWIWFVLAAVGVAYLIRRVLREGPERKVLDGLVLRLPKLGDVVMKVEIARLSRTMELLLKSGVSILTAIKIAIPVIGNKVMKAELDSCHETIGEGGFLSTTLTAAPHFPPFVSNLLRVGEESGKLDDAFGEVANWYEQESRESIKTMTQLVEPILILVIGLVLAFIVAALLLPVFSISTMVS